MTISHDDIPGKQLRGPLRGHGLYHEGRVLSSRGWGTGAGPAHCSCGANSESFDTITARQRWHREHKATARAAAGRGV